MKIKTLVLTFVLFTSGIAYSENFVIEDLIKMEITQADLENDPYHYDPDNPYGDNYDPNDPYGENETKDKTENNNDSSIPH